MAHWGWYWKVKKNHIPKKLCSNLAKLDSFKLFKDNAQAYIVKPHDIKAEVKNDHLLITYGKQKRASYKINIDKLPCHYGFYRYYFICGLCKKRARFLYLEAQSVILCRRCLNLGYKSQLLRTSMRYLDKNQQIIDFVKCKGGSIEQDKRPRYMRKQKFKRLKNLATYYEQKWHQASNKEIRQWYGVKAEPYIDECFDYVDESLKKSL